MAFLLRRLRQSRLRDAYENHNVDVDGLFMVNLEGSGGSPVYSAMMAPLQAHLGTMVASYTPLQAKGYQVSKSIHL
eukprot:186544-Rhodomonas_salina.2